MSYAVVRGNPTKSQLYFDTVIEDILKRGKVRDGVTRADQLNAAEVLFHCLKTNGPAVFVINALTDKKFTSEQILKRAVSIARTLLAKGLKGKNAIFVIRNHEHMVALYYAMIFAGVIPFMMEPQSSTLEIQQFLDPVSPQIVFCESQRHGEVAAAVKNSGRSIEIVIADDENMNKFVEGQSDDVDSFELPDVTPDSIIMMLPTSGSTGWPKATLLTHRAYVMCLTTQWNYATQFPKPTRLAFLVSTAQWMTHSLVMTSCPTYQVPIVMCPLKMTPTELVEVVDKYKPTWAFMSPALGNSIGSVAKGTQLASFEYLLLGGAQVSRAGVEELKRKMSKSAVVANGHGMTEIQSYTGCGAAGTPVESIGKVNNLIEYKIVDEDGKTLGVNEQGELYLKTKSLFKGYLNNEAAYHDCVTEDGWLKTGDIFYEDEQGQVFFVYRKKNGFKYFNHQIAPEEIESLIGDIKGVQECFACGVDKGPAVAVVLQPKAKVTADDIHRVVNETLSEYKRLRGGVYFVPAIPHNSNGKVNRRQAQELVEDIISKT